jgi:tetratricopeptide (TPR) repeat protein
MAIRPNIHLGGGLAPLLALALLGLLAPGCTEDGVVIVVHGTDAEQTWMELTGAALRARRTGTYDEAIAKLRQACKTAATFSEDDPRLGQSLVRLGDVYRRAQDYEAAEEAYLRALDATQTARGAGHVDLAPVLDRLGGIARFLGRVDEAYARHAEALVLKESLYGADSIPVAETCVPLGGQLLRMNRFEEADRMVQRAISIRERLQGPENPGVGTATLMLSRIRHRTGAYEEAATLAEHAAQLMDEESPRRAIPASFAHLGYGAACLTLARFEPALSHIESAIRVRRQVLGGEHLLVTQASLTLANHHRARGMYREAGRMYRDAEAGLVTALGARHPDVAGPSYGLADIARKLQRYDEAISLYRRVIDLSAAQAYPNPQLADAHVGSAQAHVRLGQEAQAFQHRARAFEILQIVTTADDYRRGQVVLIDAMLAARLQQYEQADTLSEQAVEMVEAALGKDHPELAEALIVWAEVRLARGKLQDAEAFALRAAELGRVKLSWTHPDVADALQVLVDVLEAAHRPEDARKARVELAQIAQYREMRGEIRVPSLRQD